MDNAAITKSLDDCVDKLHRCVVLQLEMNNFKVVAELKAIIDYWVPQMEQLKLNFENQALKSLALGLKADMLHVLDMI